MPGLSYSALATAIWQPCSHQAPPPLPHPVPSSPPLSHLTPSWEIKHIRSFKKLLKLQSEFKMSSFHPVFSGKYYILNISLLWSLFEPFNFYNLSRGMYFKIISFYIHVLKPLAKVFWLIPSHRWDLFHCAPPSPAQTNFTLMTECTPESGRCHSVCILCGG
jgi:hypothetical protein